MTQNRVEKVNLDILKNCRQQMGLDIVDVQNKVAKIAEIENGSIPPTFKQLNTLSQLYKVPRWVFISEELPDKYHFNKAVPSFRQFTDSNIEIFNNTKVRGVIAQVERFRELILEFMEDIGESITPFTPPDLDENDDPISISKIIRNWLRIPDKGLDFLQLKELLEREGVFVFMTSKYKGWSHVDKKLLRGLSLYHPVLPIIIINDSDAKKAQSFTLFHELGHLLKKENAIDVWGYHQKEIEKWCDEFSSNVLMPISVFKTSVDVVDDLGIVKKIAKVFKVSPYACLVRCRQLKIIDQNTYNYLEEQLIKEYASIQKKLKESKGGPTRNRPQEVLNQYGNIYTKVVFQAYHNQEIGLFKLSKLLDLKRASQVIEVGNKL